MKEYLIITVSVIFMSVVNLSAQSIKFYIVEDSCLVYMEYDLESKMLNSKVIDAVKTDFLPSSIYHQKNNYLLSFSRDGSIPKNSVYQNGKLLYTDSIENSELQFSNLNTNRYVVIDRFVSNEYDSFNLSIMDSCQEIFALDRNELYNSRWQIDVIDSPLFVFLGEYRCIDPQYKWFYELKIFDVLNAKIDTIETIFQNNFGNNKGYFLLNDYSCWVNNREISYLLYKPLKSRCKIEIYSYNAFSKRKKMMNSFSIPTYEESLNIKYLYGRNGKMYLSSAGRIYEVAKGNVKEILSFENKEIVGMFL